MGKQFEIVFVKDGTTIVADLLESEAPLSCEALWKGLEEPHHDKMTECIEAKWVVWY